MADHVRGVKEGCALGRMPRDGIGTLTLGDVIEIGPVLVARRGVFVEDLGEKEFRADVADLAKSGLGVPCVIDAVRPFTTRVFDVGMGVCLILEIKFSGLGLMLVGERWELCPQDVDALVHFIHFLVQLERGAVVRDEAGNDGLAHEAALTEQPKGGVRDEVMVDHRPVQELGLSIGAGQWGAVVCLLQLVGREGSQTVERVLCLITFCDLRNLVVHVLTLFYGPLRWEGCRFQNDTMEELGHRFTAIICSHQVRDHGATGTVASDDDVVGVAAKLGRLSILRREPTTSRETARKENTNLANILVHPFQGLDRVFDAIIETGGLLYFLRRQESIHSNSVIERDHDDVIPACLDQARAVHWFGEEVVSASREKDKNGQQLILCRDNRCLDIDKETVFRLIIPTRAVLEPIQSFPCWREMVRVPFGKGVRRC